MFVAAWSSHADIVKYLLKEATDHSCLAERDVVCCRKKYRIVWRVTCFIWYTIWSCPFSCTGPLLCLACLQDGRSLFYAIVRSGNVELVKWFVDKHNPPLTVTKVCCNCSFAFINTKPACLLEMYRHPCHLLSPWCMLVIYAGRSRLHAARWSCTIDVYECKCLLNYTVCKECMKTLKQHTCGPI